MIVLNRTQANNTINFIPRSYESTGANIFKIEVKKEAQNVVAYTATVSSLTKVKYYYSYTANFNLDQTKDQTYLLEISNTATNKVLYKDKIFATNQTVANYSINTGKYTTNTTGANDYLVYG